MPTTGKSTERRFWAARHFRQQTPPGNSCAALFAGRRVSRVGSPAPPQPGKRHEDSCKPFILPVGQFCYGGRRFFPNQNNVPIHKRLKPLLQSYSNCGWADYSRILLLVSRFLVHFQDCNLQHSDLGNPIPLGRFLGCFFFDANGHCCIIGFFIIQFLSFIFIGKFHHIKLIYGYTQ